MLFELWILCFIGTAFGMCLVSLLQDLRGWWRDRREAARAAEVVSGRPLHCRYHPA